MTTIDTTRLRADLAEVHSTAHDNDSADLTRAMARVVASISDYERRTALRGDVTTTEGV